MNKKDNNTNQKYLVETQYNKKKINWKKLIITSVILKLLSSTIILSALYYYHNYYHKNDQSHSLSNENINKYYIQQVDNDSLSKYLPTQSTIDLKNDHNNDIECIAQEQLSRELAQMPSKNKLILLNDFYQLKFAILNQSSHELNIKKFYNKFIEEFSNNNIANNILDIKNNFDKFYTKEQIIEQIREYLEIQKKNEFIKIEKISQRIKEEDSISEIIQKISKNEWKGALDLIQKEEINKQLAKNRIQIINNIQNKLIIENSLNSLENFLQVALELS